MKPIYINLDEIAYQGSDYLTKKQRAFFEANKALVERTRKGTKEEQLVIEDTTYDWCYNDSYEIVISKTLKNKEVERNTYTEHVFEDGTVLGEVERVRW